VAAGHKGGGTLVPILTPPHRLPRTLDGWFPAGPPPGGGPFKRGLGGYPRSQPQPNPAAVCLAGLEILYVAVSDRGNMTDLDPEAEVPPTGAVLSPGPSSTHCGGNQSRLFLSKYRICFKEAPPFLMISQGYVITHIITAHTQ